MDKRYWIYGILDFLWENKYFDPDSSLDECRSMALEEYLFGLSSSTEEEITDLFLEFMLRARE